MCIINEDVLEEYIVDGREEQYNLKAAEIFYSQNDEDEDGVQKQDQIANMFVWLKELVKSKDDICLAII